MAEPNRRLRLPQTWSEWVNADWFGVDDPFGVMPAVTEAITGGFDMFSRMLGNAATTDAGPAPPQMVLDGLLGLVRERVTGRSITLAAGEREVQVVLNDIRFRPSPIDLAVGRVGDVEVNAADVQWDDGRVERVDVRFGNVHVRPGTTPVLVTAPIELRAIVGGDFVAELVTRRAPWLAIELHEGQATVAWKGRERWGRAVVVPHLEGERIRFTAAAVAVGSRKVGVPRRVPSVLVDVPSLPAGMRVTGLALEEGTVVVDALLPELVQPLRLDRLQVLERLARAGAGRYELS
jgi:hypothetical protein